MNLNKIARVILADFTGKEPFDGEKDRRSRWTTFRRIDTDKWEIEYGAEDDSKPCCPICGKFEDHLQDDFSYSCGKQKAIRTKKLLKKIKEFNPDGLTTWVEYIPFQASVGKLDRILLQCFDHSHPERSSVQTFP